MLVEKIIQTYRQNEEDFSQDIFRASVIGKCPRRLGFQRLGLRGHPQVRAYLTFELGDAIHQILRDKIRDGLRNGLYPEFKFIKFEDEEKIEVVVKLDDDIYITGHPDGIYEKVDGKRGIIEFKSVSNYAFRRALNGEVDPDYIAQAGLYIKGLGYEEFIWVFYRKETSHLAEIVLSPFIDKIKVMERPDEHFFLVETPFNFDLDEIRDKYRKILSCSNYLDVLDVFPPAVELGVCSNCSGTGIKPYGKCRVCKGFGRLDKPWELGYPCNYCPYWNICFPEGIIEFDNEFKPKIKIG